MQLENVLLKDNTIILYYLNDGKIESLKLDTNKRKYFSFNKVSIEYDPKLTMNDKPYMVYKYLNERLPKEVTFANGVNPNLYVLPGYYDVQIYIPKGYFKNTK